LGPSITGLLVAGRNSSGIASELGSMLVTEQVDAMRAMGTDPVRKLVTPRVIATILMLPLLTALADFLGLIGGYLVSALTLRLGAVTFWTRAIDVLEFSDLMQGLSKPIFFGLILSTVGCYQGLNVKGGTQGGGPRDHAGGGHLFCIHPGYEFFPHEIDVVSRGSCFLEADSQNLTNRARSIDRRSRHN
jgi:phospholipid/cholesterol/gamma-HCH transport system permease protein